mgnify:CR=1 FL=1
MNFNNFTIKSQEAVQQAVNLVQSRGQQAIEPEHLLAGVLKVGENVTNFIFQKLGINGQQIETVLDKQIASLPKVSGGEPYLSRDANEVLQKAVEFSKSLGDEYVSLEAIILAFAQCKKYRIYHLERCWCYRQRSCGLLSVNFVRDKMLLHSLVKIHTSHSANMLST